jgi:hypothetical protein
MDRQFVGVQMLGRALLDLFSPPIRPKWTSLITEA